MRIGFALAVCAVVAAAQQRPSFTIEQVLSAAFPSDLTAAPSGAKVAWISNLRGQRSIHVAAPNEQLRMLIQYPDNGQEISELRWTPDASAIVYTLGGEANRTGQNPNPALDPKGSEQAVWMVRVAGGSPVRLGAGSQPEVSPKGDRVIFVSHGQLWSAALTGGAPATQLLHARGGAEHPRWSPDGNRIAFEMGRGDHSLIGVYDLSTATLKFLDPSTDYDSWPEWTDDGRSIAFLRMPSDGLRPIRKPERAGEPWSIRVASVDTGAGRELWRAKTGPGSIYRGVTARNQLLMAAGNRIVFPWEGDGWTHLYSIGIDGGSPVALTPGAFEVEDVALVPRGRDVIYSSNDGDIDRRHLWRVSAAGGAPSQITRGDGIEVAPAPLSDGNVAWLASDARRPLHPVSGRDLGLSETFPTAQMIVPQQVIFPAADGLEIHGQLFVPPGRAAGTRSPAVVFFHGGSRRQMLLGWHPMYYYFNAYAMNEFLANSGYVVLSVNYRSGIGYGLNFREALNYGPAGGSEFKDVQAAGVFLRSRADIDGSRIGVWGGSYGGYLTAMALARASDIFKVGVDFHGVHDWARELNIPAGEPDYKLAFESSPMNFLDGWQSPVLLIAGDDDPDVQFNQTVMLADALRRKGVEMKELIIPDEGHDFWMWKTWLKTYQATIEFLESKLKR